MQAKTEVGHHNGQIHILEVIGAASKGGMENYIKNFLANLPPNQFRITCICPNESAFTTSLRQLGVEEVFITPITDDPQWRSIQLAIEVSRLYHIDVLHAHMPKAHVLAGLAGNLLHKPVVATVHGMHLTAYELGVTRAVGSHLITNCQEAYIQALAMGVSPERVTHIRNGIDTTAFTPEHSATKFLKSINVPPGTPLVGFVGRLELEKGPDLFVRVANYVHQLRPDIHFVIAGEGAMLKQLQNMCAQLGLKQHVHFVGWWNNTANIYPALDLLVHTSRSDGTSLVLLEAMACAKPIVALGVGGVLEIIENESTGILAKADDWENAAKVVVQLLEKPKLLASMGTAARARIEKHFNLSTNTKRTTEVLRNIALQGLNGQRLVHMNPLNEKATLDSSAEKVN